MEQLYFSLKASASLSVRQVFLRHTGDTDFPNFMPSNWML